MKIIFQILFVIIFTLCSHRYLLAADLTILTFDEPPSSYMDNNGELTGFAVDIVREIQHRLSNNNPIKLLPEMRALSIASGRSNVVLFSFSRTPDRENKYHWITLLMRKPWVFYTKKTTPLVLHTIGDARKINKIGVVKGIRSTYLERLGFENLETVTHNWQNIRKLLSGRIHALYYEPQGMATECQRLGIPFSDFKQVLVTNYSGVYIVMSKDTDPVIVKNWRDAARTIKHDGTFQRIAEKWAAYMSKKYGIICNVGINALNF